MISFKGTILLSENDHQFISTVCNRVVELTPNGAINKEMNFDEFVENEELQNQINEMYK